MRPRTKRRIVRGVVALVAALVVSSGGFVAWAMSPLGPERSALDAMASDASVDVVRSAEGYVFSPKAVRPRVGLVFYPGGHVDPRSYAPLAHRIADHGYLVVIQPMPLNLAVLAPDRARQAIEAHPEVVAWAVGGHSLGGSMAARFALRPEVRGLALLAAYPPEGVDLSRRDLKAVSVWGTLDGKVTASDIVRGKPFLPNTTEFITLTGGNHAQFGAYGAQTGDRDAAMAAGDQLETSVTAILQMLRPIRTKAQ